MLHLVPGVPANRPLRVLALGAHADDIEIGAGGALLAMQREGPVVVTALILSATPERRAEAESSAQMLYADAVDWSIDVREFEENIFPSWVPELKATLAEFASATPDIVFAPRLLDRHQDHRTLAELTWQTFREHVILQYEIPKWEGDLFTPNAYVEFDDSIIARKVEIVEQAFVSQRDKHWFDARTFTGLARLRGVECGQTWAEGFYADKLMVGTSRRPVEEEI